MSEQNLATNRQAAELREASTLHPGWRWGSPTQSDPSLFANPRAHIILPAQMANPTRLRHGAPENPDTDEGRYRVSLAQTLRARGALASGALLVTVDRFIWDERTSVRYVVPDTPDDAPDNGPSDMFVYDRTDERQIIPAATGLMASSLTVDTIMRMGPAFAEEDLLALQTAMHGVLTETGISDDEIIIQSSAQGMVIHGVTMEDAVRCLPGGVYSEEVVALTGLVRNLPNMPLA